MCGNPLTRNIDSNNNTIYRPIMTFLLINIKQQLALFFCHKDFEISCQMWEKEKEKLKHYSIFMMVRSGNNLKMIMATIFSQKNLPILTLD
jgi:hypothetical protein